MVEQQADAYGGTIFSGAGDVLTRCPQAAFAQMRSVAPAMRIEGSGVVVTTRAAMTEVFRHPEIYSSQMPAGHFGNARPLIPIEVDPPDQRKFRKILDPLFTPKQLEHLAGPIEVLANDLIDSFIDEPEIDFAQRFSVPFPSQVFLTMFGLPMQDLPKFLAMKDGIIRPFHVLGTSLNDPRTQELREQSAASIYDYFNEVLDQREAERREDLLSHFLVAEVEGERLTREEILDICFLLLIAGLDTVSASLDCFFRYLAEHPDKRAALVADPSISPWVVEELLRWESPVMLVSRVATQDTELGGCPIHAGDKVHPFLGSGNTDESEFPDAEVIRWGRKGNRHIAFGAGIHRCLGSNLARLELRIALRVWHSRIPHYRVKPGTELVYTIGVRSVDSFPMVLGESV
ncbi:cytochrome P450 [Mycobacterium malmoense]|uniref:cytochrome P450 n=1 Tax=Mycobacterium malmoense TaxID=1780 RepID=UPI0009F30C6E|nr:cytochrome P450 [Mycobacterium malmoense]